MSLSLPPLVQPVPMRPGPGGLGAGIPFGGGTAIVPAPLPPAIIAGPTPAWFLQPVPMRPGPGGFKRGGVFGGSTARPSVPVVVVQYADLSLLFLAELTVFDPSIQATRVLRYASGQGFVTGPVETPPNSWYDARIQQPAVVKRDLFLPGATQGGSRIGYGDLILLNPDGLLDVLLDYGFDGRPITIWQGSPGAAYPSGFTQVLVGTMQQCLIDFSTVTIKIRDRVQETAVPLQPTKYAGSNVLPAGLEGVATDLQGKPKPICYGKVLNVPAVCVNTSKLIYQVHDGPVASIDAVYDRGIPLLMSMTWATHTSTFGASAISAATYGAGLFVVGGDAGKLATSPDGITWTTRGPIFGGGDGVFALAYSPQLGLFVAGGSGANIATSPDGITWTPRASGFGTGAILSIAWGNGLFVAVGSSVPGSQGAIATSPDGITWTQQSCPFGSSMVLGVAAGGGFFVVIGLGGKLATSPDGTTWTLQTSSFGTTNIQAVIYGAGQFIAAGAAGSLATSPDGQVWTQRVSQFGATAINALAYGNGIYLAAGDSGKLATSYGGSIWALTTSAFSATGIASATFGGGIFVLVGASGTLSSTAGYSAYASSADLLDDTKAPSAGSIKIFLNAAGSYFRLGASPAGLITADLTEGTTAADRTTAQLFKRALIRAGKSAVDWNASDLAALDAASSAVLGFWTDQEMTLAQLLDQIAMSTGCWWGVDRTGVFRIAQFTAPTGDPIASFTENDLIKPLARVTSTDQGNGIPVWRTIVRHQRIYAVQTTDLAGGVPQSRRNLVGLEWREAQASDATVLTAHLLATQTIEDSLLTTAADAQAEASRRLLLRDSRWDVFTAVVLLDRTTVAIDLGSVIRLSHPRFGLAAGQLFRVIGVEPNGIDRTLTLTLWGVAGGVVFWGYLTQVAGIWGFSRDLADRAGQLVLSGASVVINNDPLAAGLKISIDATPAVTLATI